MQKFSSHRPSERGAVLIMVAISIIALLAFSAFVVDYGVMWVSRSQVQTAADAGALAGATARAFDSDTSNAHVQAVAIAVGQANAVWAQAPDIQTRRRGQSRPCPLTPGWAADTCVRVNAYRNQSAQQSLANLLRLAGRRQRRRA